MANLGFTFYAIEAAQANEYTILSYRFAGRSGASVLAADIENHLASATSVVAPQRWCC